MDPCDVLPIKFQEHLQVGLQPIRCLGFNRQLNVFLLWRSCKP